MQLLVFIIVVRLRFYVFNLISSFALVYRLEKEEEEETHLKPILF